MKIVYINDNGILSVVHPMQDNLSQAELIQLGKNVIPKGKKFKVIKASELPVDRTYRDAWTIDESLLTDGVGEYDPS